MGHLNWPSIIWWSTAGSIAVFIGVEIGKITRNWFDGLISRWCGNEEEDDGQ